MYYRLFILLLAVFVLSCSNDKIELGHDHGGEAGHDHGEEAGQDDHGHGGGEIENIRFTEFSKLHEMFTEMTPLINGNESEFIVHFTKLSDFKPVTSGSLKIEFSGAINETISANSIKRNGIFIIPFIPKATGTVGITFIYTNENISDTIIVPSQKCYSSMEEAKKDEIPSESGITFLKEESWKIDFALTQVISTNFSETVKAAGKIINNPADEIIITATASGVVEFADNSLTPGKKVSSGSKMFSIKSGTLRADNMELNYTLAKSNFERAKKEFDRISELNKLKISSEKEFLDAKSSYENAEAILRNYSQSADGKSITIKSPKTAYLNKMMVNQGQFVEAGTPLAVLTNNNRLVVKVDLPANEYSKLNSITDANFLIGDNAINMRELNGKIVGNPINSSSSSFVSIYIQIDNKLNFLPNSFITVFLFGDNVTNSISVPKESLWEDQGNYFVFVQKHGELFEKREVTINGFDGFNYLIGSGLNQGEVIVNKGTYRVMLASKSSDLPSNSHAH